MENQPQQVPPANLIDHEIDDVNADVWKYIRSKYIPHIIIYILLSASAIYFFPNRFTLIVVFVVGSIFYLSIYSKVKREFTEQFGASIGFAYTDTADMKSVSGKLFEAGHSQNISDVLTGSYQNIPMRFFTYSFTVGEGKNSHTYSYTVFEATMTGTVPDILLSSVNHSTLVGGWGTGQEKVELEGDFNKYFKLTVPKGYEQEAYEIFTPDVMANLIDKAKDVSFEFVGNKLYIYATEIITKREKLQQVFGLSEFLIHLFQKNIDSIAYITPASLAK
jgi:hypothetical protein